MNQSNFKTFGLARLGVFAQVSGALLGICGLYHMSDSEFKGKVGVAYRFPKIHWGMGYAPEVANALVQYGIENLKLDSVSAIIDPANSRSSRVVEKIGMKFISKMNYKGQIREHWMTLAPGK